MGTVESSVSIRVDPCSPWTISAIPGQTLATKLKRGTPFSVAESRRLARTFQEHGLAVP